MVSFIGSFHRLPGVCVCVSGEEGMGEGRGKRDRGSGTFLNKLQAKSFQSGTTQVDGNEVQVALDS